MPQWQLKLLYDGECPFCRREVEWLKRRDRHGHLAFEDISELGFSPAKYHLTPEEVQSVLHGVLPDGRRGPPDGGGAAGIPCGRARMARRPFGLAWTELDRGRLL